ncbi:MAG: hypothetical protein AAFN65_03865 [Bacteroidota bacterium]
MRKSKKLIEQRFHDYNSLQSNRKDRLKSGDMQLAFYLVEIAAAQLRDDVFSAKIRPFEHLPFFRVSNPLLAKKLGCTPRTIQNRRRRLENAGILNGYRWRTSYQKYDLRLCWSFLYVQEFIHGPNANELFYPRKNTADQLAAYAEKFSSLRSWEPNREPILKKQEGEGVDLWADIDHDYGLPPELVYKPETEAGNTPQASQKPGDPEQGTEKVAAKSEPERPKYDQRGVRTSPPRSWAEVTESLKRLEAQKLWGIACRLWARCATWNWFGTGYVVSAQQDQTRYRIAEWFTYYHPDCWDQLEVQLLKRIELVQGWVEKKNKARADDPAKGVSPIWFPPPADYFDIRSEAKFSFTKTRIWYMNWRDKKKETAEKAAITKAINRLKQAALDYNPYALEVEYRDSLEKLAKYGDTAMQSLNDHVIEIYGSTSDLLP